MGNEKIPKGVRILIAAVGVTALAGLALLCLYSIWERPPELEPESVRTEAAASPAPSAAPSATPEPMPEGLPFDTPRADGVYTLLLAGVDAASGSTDTILVGRIDTVRHEMNFVSIPRDLIINADWSVRKINSVYAGSLNNGGSGVDALLQHIRRLLGFEVDCYGVIDLGTFQDVVDGLGGVYFDVPFDMDYEDAGQGLSIHLKAGYQLLDGAAAMGLCRFRADYVTGDLGRIEMQQAFLRACAEQFITLGSIPNARIVAKALAERLNTNLSAANIAWFMRQALLCKSGNVHFDVMPCDDDLLQGYSYAIPRLWDWLELVNARLNPYDSPITYGNVDLVYRDGGRYTATTGLRGRWYFAAPAAASTAVPAAAPTPQGPTVIQVTPRPAEPDPTETPAETPGPEASPRPVEDDTPDFARRLGGG